MFGILLPDTTEVPFHWDFSSLFNFCVKFLCLESTIFISELKIKQKSAVACAGWEGKDKAGKKGVAPTLYSNKSAPADWRVLFIRRPWLNMITVATIDCTIMI